MPPLSIGQFLLTRFELDGMSRFSVDGKKDWNIPRPGQERGGAGFSGLDQEAQVIRDY
jgi:hypothetical protein